VRLGSPLSILAWTSVLVVGGCVATPGFQALERDVAELKRGATSPSDAGRISERLADLGEEVAELRSEVRQLRGEVEGVRHAAAGRTGLRPPAPQAAPGTPREAPPDAAEPGDSATTASDIGKTAIRGPDPRETALAGGGTPLARSSEIREYEDAFRIYRAGDYQRAIDQFRTFLQTHPSSDYADNAHFWMGECYFKLGDYERAVLVFEDVVKIYPEGNKVPDALYRQGRALLQIGARSQQAAAYTPAARQVFQRIVTEHPDSERASEAKRQLERLGP
jgi:tol-pal system protein YbgF